MQKSAIWRHFTEIGPERKVTCLYCPQQLSVANKSTCSLIRHMTKKHPHISIRSTEAQGSEEEVLIINEDNVDANSDSPDDRTREYDENEEKDDSDAEGDTEPDQKPLRIIHSKPKPKQADQRVISAMTEARRQIGEALISMKSLKRQRNDEDEYDHFGHMIASKLRKIQNVDQREIAMHSVYNVVYEALMKNI